MLPLGRPPGPRTRCCSSRGVPRRCEHRPGCMDQLHRPYNSTLLFQDAVDPDFSSAVPGNMLMFANGFKVDNTDNNPNVIRSADGPGYRTEIIPAQPDVFRLPKAGSVVEAPPVLLSGKRLL